MMKVIFSFAFLLFCLEVSANSDLDNQLLTVADNGNMDAVKDLINRGANVNSQDDLNETPLHKTAERGFTEIVKYLIDNGANVSAANGFEETSLHMAALNGHIEIVKILIGKGGNVNVKNDHKETPLHMAAFYGHIEIIKYLVDHGADVSARSDKNETPLAMAQNKDNLNTIQQIQSAAMITLHRAEAIEFLLKFEKISKAKVACSQFSVQFPEDLVDKRLTPRVLGGDVAEEGEFPWMAALFYLDDLRVRFGCGGTVISEYYIMTAAHCTNERPVKVRLGKVSLNDTYTDVIRASYYSIENITRHPNYSSVTKKNDIALIRLTKKIYFSNTIRPACLHTDMNDVDTKLIVTGWGSTDLNRSNSHSYQLRKIEINTTPLRECNNIYFNSNQLWNLPSFRYGISDGQYCTFDPIEKNDACIGDSGGPVQLIDNKDPKNVTIVAIVSFGMSCGLDLPGINTRVAHYISWIESVVWP
ncbi:serine protease persephone-like [Contarinia nasturtii]|uniref:serine protease persephone-like n=1 Tax=Contarinia nasturtii TaxID=265458 RepID=UPI0012D3C92E|nr:serine protease persephone-like [Contarinia nasturtii]